ncbi:MAG: ABC transporter ATP-binding protein [Chloroflexota bacterium]
MQSGASALGAERLSTGYGAALVLEDVTVSPPPGEITAIVGPNACGKSTLLRTLARLLSPVRGDVFLDGRAVSHGKHKDLARRLAWLSQGAATPPGVTVEDLVAVGRYPYQRWYRQWSREDQRAVDAAMDATGVSELRWQPVDTLSGGQRQRVWLAMALAQQTGVLLLDEPTTFLDIAHQVEALDLVWEMNRREGRTVVLVLHDLGQACRYADYIIAMKGGRVVTAGQPQDVVTPSLVREVFDVPCCVVPDPVCGKPLVLPGRDSEDSLLRLREAEEQRAAADHSERDASRTARSYALSG